VFPVICDAAREIGETLNDVIVGVLFVVCAGGAHVDFELQTVKRMFPRSHLCVHESMTTVSAESGDVNVMIDESLRIDVVKRALDQIGSFRVDARRQLLRVVTERAADVVNQAHPFNR
jgi:hypothetical protein